MLFNFICFVNFQFPTLPEGRYVEPDSCDWHGRSSNLPSLAKEKSWDAGKENRGSSNRFGREEKRVSTPNSREFKYLQTKGEDLLLLWSRPRHLGLLVRVIYLNKSVF